MEILTKNSADKIVESDSKVTVPIQTGPEDISNSAMEKHMQGSPIEL